MGYLSKTGTSLQPDSVGILGFAAGKLYYAGFSEAGNAATQLDWWEAWVDAAPASSGGTITVRDVDGPGRSALPLTATRTTSATDSLATSR